MDAHSFEVTDLLREGRAVPERAHVRRVETVYLAITIQRLLVVLKGSVVASLRAYIERSCSKTHLDCLARSAHSSASWFRCAAMILSWSAFFFSLMSS